MLPAASKLRRSQDFSTVVRSGHRGGTRHLVVHLFRATRTASVEEASVIAAPSVVQSVDAAAPHPYRASAPPRAGFVVSTAVGNSVVRHRVTRRLRPLVNERLPTLPAGTDLVIRALPAAATATSSQLASDLDAGLRAAGRKADRAGLIPTRQLSISSPSDSSTADVSTDVVSTRADSKHANSVEGTRQ